MCCEADVPQKNHSNSLSYCGIKQSASMAHMLYSLCCGRDAPSLQLSTAEGQAFSRGGGDRCTQGSARLTHGRHKELIGANQEGDVATPILLLHAHRCTTTQQMTCTTFIINDAHVLDCFRLHQANMLSQILTTIVVDSTESSDSTISVALQAVVAAGVGETVQAAGS